MVRLNLVSFSGVVDGIEYFVNQKLGEAFDELLKPTLAILEALGLDLKIRADVPPGQGTLQ